MSPLEISPVLKMPVEARAAAILRDSIISGAIPLGTRITESSISAQMRLSRATVRTAFHQLSAEGLINLVPYTGWTVTTLTSQDVWELYTLRSAIERLASRLVAGKLTSEIENTLQKAYNNLLEASDSEKEEETAEADFMLHKAVIVLADHSRMTWQYGLIQQQVRMYIRSSDALLEEPAVVVEQHRPIVQAILAGNVEEAGNLSEQHNISEGKKLVDHLRQEEKENEVGWKKGTS